MNYSDLIAHLNGFGIVLFTLFAILSLVLNGLDMINLRRSTGEYELGSAKSDGSIYLEWTIPAWCISNALVLVYDNYFPSLWLFLNVNVLFSSIVVIVLSGSSDSKTIAFAVITAVMGSVAKTISFWNIFHVREHLSTCWKNIQNPKPSSRMSTMIMFPLNTQVNTSVALDVMAYLGWSVFWLISFETLVSTWSQQSTIFIVAYISAWFFVGVMLPIGWILLTLNLRTLCTIEHSFQSWETWFKPLDYDNTRLLSKGLVLVNSFIFITLVFISGA